MAIEKITIEKFLELAKELPVLDVRSPAEYNHAHIPDAFSLPLFTNEERVVVGTTYKQKSREAAIKVGLDFFGPKMKSMVEQVEEICNAIPTPPEEVTRRQLLVHCWRGGMRSAAVAWLLDLYGFKVYTLAGGYKKFRNWVLDQFQKEYLLKILGGYTGSGKTLILKEMLSRNFPVIDLEQLANHKGSAFGALGEYSQPSQEMFENLLAKHLAEVGSRKYEVRKDDEEVLTSCFLPHSSCIWLEDESQRIGKVVIPHNIWEQMRNSKVYFLEIPFEERLNFIVQTYGSFPKDKLTESIERIQKRLGGLETKNAVDHLLAGNITECFRILLNYYDKLYKKGLYQRKNYENLLNIIPCTGVNASINLRNLFLQEV